MELEENSSYHRALVTACTLVGGESQLAERFGVPVEMVRNWVGGSSPVPAVVFLSAADIIREHNERVYIDARELRAEMKRREPS